jgi:hypothetical protein
MTGAVVRINRAPVLTLWAAVVAERLGFGHDEALTLGRAVAGLNAYSKGKALGLFKPTPADIRAARARKARSAGAFQIELLHRAVPVVRTTEGLRAISKGTPIDPDAVAAYLRSKFGGSLGPVTDAMTALARAHDEAELSRRAYELYEAFRPDVPAGESGWGARGTLDTVRIRALAPAD